MDAPRESTPAVITHAMWASAVVSAQFIAGKAARDAIFLAHHDVTALPLMIAATAAVSIALVMANARILRRVPPARLIPWLCAASGGGLLVSWGVLLMSPPLAGPLVYLVVSGVGPMLGSGFWLIASERFDPRTAKQRFGQIAGAGTLGGLAGGLLAERVAAIASIDLMLPVLAAFGFLAAWQMRTLAAAQVRPSPARVQPDAELAAEAPQSGFRVIRKAPYLRDLAALVLLGTVAAALLDYVFKARAVTTFGRGDLLPRFFAIYYAAISVVTFVLQSGLSRAVLERLGLAATTASPSIALVAGGIGSLLAPGFESVIVARGGEAVVRGSLFRSAYEVLYTPIPVQEKRAAKSAIDVGFDRLGDAIGGGLIRLLLAMAPLAPQTAMILASIGCSAAAAIIASRVGGGYLKTLEQSLLNRAVEIDLNEVRDGSTRTAMLRTLAETSRVRARASAAAPAASAGALLGPPPTATAQMRLDPDVQRLLALRSRNRDRVLEALTADAPLAAALIPDAIQLLAWEAVCGPAMKALGAVADEHVGTLSDALLDPRQDFAIRRRLARVFQVCSSQRAVDALLLALDDLRFEVRYHAGGSLSAIHRKEPALVIPGDRVQQVVLREAAVSKAIWTSDRLLPRADEGEPPLTIDAVLKDRASRSLAHVFTLLSLVLPPEPLQVAFYGLHVRDQALRGTALEYLEGVLPSAVRDALWPYLDDQRPPRRAVTRDKDAIVAELMRSHPSMTLNLQDLAAAELDRAMPQSPVQKG
jgi:ATP:ADP antiporter, AAA family